MKKLLARLDLCVDKVTTVLMVTGCIVMTVTVLIGAFTRYVFKMNTPWTEEVTMIGAMYLYFFGMIYAQRRDDEICAEMMSLFTKNPVVLAFFKILKHGFSLLICVIGTKWVLDFILQTAKLNPHFSVTKWPQMIYRFPMLICFTFMGIYLLKHLLDAIVEFKAVKAGKTTQDEEVDAQ